MLRSTLRFGFLAVALGACLLVILNGSASAATQGPGFSGWFIHNMAPIMFASLVVFLLHGQVLLVLGLVAGAFNIVGNYLGSHSFSKNGGAVARPITIVVLVIFFAKVIWDFVA